VHGVFSLPPKMAQPLTPEEMDQDLTSSLQSPQLTLSYEPKCKKPDNCVMKVSKDGKPYYAHVADPLGHLVSAEHWDKMCTNKFSEPHGEVILSVLQQKERELKQINAAKAKYSKY
jgi:hypothetical protein